MCKIKHLRPPTQLILYTDPIKDIEDIKADKKIKLQFIKGAFIFVLSSKQKHIVFIHYKNNIIRINKVLKDYTQETDLKQQFLCILKNPKKLLTKDITLIIIETLYIFSSILNIDLKQYIKYISLDDLICYYFLTYKINNTI